MRVLIVEDEQKIALSIQKGLQQESFAADVAYTGEEGLALARSEPYDLIILDLMLPYLDGFAITQQLRSDKMNTPILMLTAKDAVEDVVKGLSTGADDYLTKPFAFEELLARIQALLRRPTQLLSEILKIDGLTMNTQTFEVKRENKVISLSQKEYSLLEYLMRHPNKILRKENIIAHVWDYHADILPNTLEVYIGYLRSKIDKPFSPKHPPLIHTLRGFGYKIGS